MQKTVATHPKGALGLRGLGFKTIKVLTECSAAHMGLRGVTGSFRTRGEVDAQAAEAMVPKIRGTILGIPIIRIIVYCGLYMGVPYFGKLPLLKLDLDLTFETHAETKPSSPNTATRTLFKFGTLHERDPGYTLRILRSLL